MDLLSFGPGGFPSQLAPTTNRNGRGRRSLFAPVLVVVKVRKAGSVGGGCGCCFVLMARVACPCLHRIDGRDIRWGCSGVKLEYGIRCHGQIRKHSKYFRVKSRSLTRLAPRYHEGMLQYTKVGLQGSSGPLSKDFQ